MRRIPANEIHLVFVRSAGPGGQNVNKTSTKAQLHWNVGASAAFSSQEKNIIRTALRSRLNKEDDIVIQAGDTRSQSQNKETAIERLERLVSQALAPRAKRIPTKPTRSSKERRLASKKLQSQKKQSRRHAID